MSENIKTASLYLHIPFCRAKCHYCDFLSFANCNHHFEPYVNALVKELEQKSEGLADHEIVTVFIGGGTPTVLPPVLLNRITDAVQENYQLSENCEFTIESNPGTLTKELRDCIIAGPINRISMGLQTTDDGLMDRIGRIHRYEDFRRNYEDLRAGGMININVDLMFGLPGQSLESFRESLEIVASLVPEHLSCYSLIIEEGTPFARDYKKGKLLLPQEDVERQMYYLCQDFLETKGYHRYEVSNYAKSGYECRHNVVYWTLGKYLGFGIGAHSYEDGIRYENTKSIEAYLKESEQGAIQRHHQVHVDKKSQMEEFMFLGLRLTKGISAQEFYDMFQVSIEDVYQSVLEAQLTKGLLKKTEKGYQLTSKGVDVSNHVLSEYLL